MTQSRPPVIDIHVHTFGGGPGQRPMCPWPPQFLASDPKTVESSNGWSNQNCVLALQLLLEDLLARHPKLRLWVMHAGYPMIDNMLTLLQANSHVHVDVAGLIWSYPRIEVDRYIQRLVEAGFGDRILFGTD